MSGNSYGLLRSSFFPSPSTSCHSSPEKQLIKSENTGSTATTGVTDDDMAALQQMDSVFDEIESIMRQNNHKVAATGHSFSATSVMTYINDGQGAPKVYKASVATRFAPGGIRETRKASRDSVSGIEKVSVDRRMGDRGHLEERLHNHVTSQREEQTEFINMDEEDTEDFEEEWRRKLKHDPLSGGVINDKDRGFGQSGVGSQNQLPSSFLKLSLNGTSDLTGTPLTDQLDKTTSAPQNSLSPSAI